MNSFGAAIPAFLFAFLFAFSFQPTPVLASPNKCAELFLSAAQKSKENHTQTIRQKAKQYGSEVVESRGQRLFLKNSEKDGDPSMWYGFLSKQRLDVNKTGTKKYLSSIATYVPRKIGRAMSREDGYVFTPFVGLYNLTFKMPVEYVTARYGNKKMEPAFFFKFPVVMALSIGVYFGADAVYQNRLQSHVNYEIAQHSVEYDKAIQSDFRYQKIKLAVEKGEMSLDEAHREAYLISLAYSQYFQFRDAADSVPSLQSEMKLLNHYLFTHLRNVVTNGVQKADLTDGYYVPQSVVGKLTDSQKLELFNNNHQRYLKYQIISEMVSETPLWEQIRNSPRMQALVESLTNDPFTVQLYELHDSGRITSAQLQSYLQEDAYWQNRFQDWKTIGVTRL
ncbi:MAG: hypothetical protein LW875_11230, partial [Proteobacteria bacterium]|nr:hypothetical protein [Pseudomonadota bacterium]